MNHTKIKDKLLLVYNEMKEPFSLIIAIFLMAIIIISFIRIIVFILIVAASIIIVNILCIPSMITELAAIFNTTI